VGVGDRGRSVLHAHRRMEAPQETASLNPQARNAQAATANFHITLYINRATFEAAYNGRST